MNLSVDSVPNLEIADVALSSAPQEPQVACYWLLGCCFESCPHLIQPTRNRRALALVPDLGSLGPSRAAKSWVVSCLLYLSSTYVSSCCFDLLRCLIQESWQQQCCVFILLLIIPAHLQLVPSGYSKQELILGKQDCGHELPGLGILVIGFQKAQQEFVLRLGNLTPPYAQLRRSQLAPAHHLTACVMLRLKLAGEAANYHPDHRSDPFKSPRPGCWRCDCSVLPYGPRPSYHSHRCHSDGFDNIFHFYFVSESTSNRYFCLMIEV